MTLPEPDDVKMTAELNRHAAAMDMLTAAYMALCDTCASVSLLKDLHNVIDIAKFELDLSSE